MALKLYAPKPEPGNIAGLSGRRVLALGASLAPLAHGALSGTNLELASVDQLSGASADDIGLVLIDADSCTAAALAAAVQSLTACVNPPAVLLVGERLPTPVVRNLLRLSRSDVLEAPYTPEQIAQAVSALMEQDPRTPPVQAPLPAPAAPPVAASRCWAVTRRGRRLRRDDHRHRDRHRPLPAPGPRKERLPDRPEPGRRGDGGLPRCDPDDETGRIRRQCGPDRRGHAAGFRDAGDQAAGPAGGAA